MKKKCKLKRIDVQRTATRRYAQDLAEMFEVLMQVLDDDCCWPRYPLGRLVITPGVEAVLTPEDVIDAVVRHGLCDWGDVSQRETMLNWLALQRGGVVISNYRSPQGLRFWLQTRSQEGQTWVLVADSLVNPFSSCN